jgi:hypothetical protein
MNPTKNPLIFLKNTTNNINQHEILIFWILLVQKLISNINSQGL